MSADKKSVVVGMSGGVDSSVAAYLLKESGYDVIGVTMRIWQDGDDCGSGSCCGMSAVEDARRVADVLDIPYYVMNLKDIFKKCVVDYFVKEYLTGRTPNPCIACNRYLKWEALLDRALGLGADYIATGHYARIIRQPETNRYTLEAVADKDQTYALYSLTQSQLGHTLMPVGGYTKDEIRRIAASIGLPVANKPDSQEICFIPGNDYGRFIEGYTGMDITPGWFVDENGHKLGQHRGIINYTIGQRKGLGVSFGKPMFVKKIDPHSNEITLADNAGLFESCMMVEHINFMSAERLTEPMAVQAKIRYTHKPADCTIKMLGDKLECRFTEPQRAITPGQAAVFYSGGLIVCGGMIC